MILGILGVTLCSGTGLVGLAGLITGIIAIKKNAGKGFGIAGLITGILSVLIFVGLVIFYIIYFVIIGAALFSY
ncbi:MAG: hypothetical protein IJ291_07015 [Lachnospiraceae bacterium]|nr:hypothetical protein [Lachnospiraceae bacterium]